VTEIIFLGRIKSSEIDENRVKSSQAAPIIHVHDVGPYVSEPVPDEDWLKSYREKKQSRRTS
jgi:hypothetical protein